MTNTTENQSVVEFELDRVDAEELLYGTIGYELTVGEQSDERIELVGTAIEQERFARLVWAPLAKSKGWRPARIVIWNGKTVE